MAQASPAAAAGRGVRVPSGSAVPSFEAEALWIPSPQTAAATHLVGGGACAIPRAAAGAKVSPRHTSSVVRPCRMQADGKVGKQANVAPPKGDRQGGQYRSGGGKSQGKGGKGHQQSWMGYAMPPMPGMPGGYPFGWPPVFWSGVKGDKPRTRGKGEGKGGGKGTGKSDTKKWTCNSCGYGKTPWSAEDCGHCGMEWQFKGDKHGDNKASRPANFSSRGGQGSSGGAAQARPGKTGVQQAEEKPAKPGKGKEGGTPPGRSKPDSKGWQEVLHKRRQAQGGAEGGKPQQDREQEQVPSTVKETGARHFKVEDVTDMEGVVTEGEEGYATATELEGGNTTAKAKGGGGPPSGEKKVPVEEQLQQVQEGLAALRTLQKLGLVGDEAELESWAQELKNHENDLGKAQGQAAGRGKEAGQAKPTDILLQRSRQKLAKFHRKKEKLEGEAEELRAVQADICEYLEDLKAQIEETEKKIGEEEESKRALAARLAEEAGVWVRPGKGAAAEDGDSDRESGGSQSAGEGSGDEGDDDDGAERKVKRRRKVKGKAVPSEMQVPQLAQHLLRQIRPEATKEAAEVHKALGAFLAKGGASGQGKEGEGHPESDLTRLLRMELEAKNEVEAGDERAKPKLEAIRQVTQLRWGKAEGALPSNPPSTGAGEQTPLQEGGKSAWKGSNTQNRFAPYTAAAAAASSK